MEVSSGRGADGAPAVGAAARRCSRARQRRTSAASDNHSNGWIPRPSGGRDLDHGCNMRSGREPSSMAMRSAADVSDSWSAPPRASPVPASARSRSGSSRWSSCSASSAERGRGLLAWDVRFAYLPAAEAVLDGDSPYPALDDPILEDQKGYVYPPQLLLALVPFTAASGPVVARSWRSAARAPRAHAVRPRRPGRALLRGGLPLGAAISGVLSRTSRSRSRSPSLSLWRYRDACGRRRAALGLAVSAKLLFWPLFVWMLATRRLRAAALSVALGARRDARRLGGDRLRRASRVPGSPPPALRHPVRAQLLVRGHGRGRLVSPSVSVRC